ncbi:fucosyl transferase, partial [Aphelenchoides avenae]
FVPIDAFGKCYSGRCDAKCMESNVKSHKFIIAMENSVCEDYVTEKFFRIKQLIVPIVLRQQDYLHIAPKGSFIAVDQFE